MRKKLFIIIPVLLILFNLFLVYSQSDVKKDRKLIVFYSPTCHKCIEAKKHLIPQIQKEFKDEISIEYRDISDIENYKLLLSLQDEHKVEIKNILPVFYFEGSFLNSEREVGYQLKQLIVKSLGKSLKPKPQLSPIDLEARFKTFKPFAIITAGLLDGINPCAFTVIVFFISFLALQGYRKKELIIIGFSFIFAVFSTYIFIGLGIFGFLYRFKGFWILIRIFNLLVGIFSIVLGIFCLYDFFRFKKTRNTEELVLQLPKIVKNQIHKIIGLHYRRDKPKKELPVNSKRQVFKLLLSALITGFLVSILEAVCTGQVYLPTIAFVLKTTPLKLEALLYLLLYNSMFIVPLLVIFFLAILGVTSEQFSKILNKHLLTLKILMAGLFFGLGIFLLWRI